MLFPERISCINMFVKYVLYLTLFSNRDLVTGLDCDEDSCADILSLPLLDGLKATLKADLDVTKMNQHLSDYIKKRVEYGIETIMNEVVQAKIDEGLNKANATIALTIQQTLKETSIGGAAYVQWGRSVCTSQNANLVYDGITGSASFQNKGSAVNYLCLPKQPQWGVYDDKANNNPFVGGTIFDIQDINIKNSLFDQGKYSAHGLPCSVCHVTGGTTVMIPGRKECLSGWKEEYTGYLMSGHHTHDAATEFICVDSDSEILRKISTWNNEGILYPVIAKCNDVLPCPPYVNGREMTCVVCSK